MFLPPLNLFVESYTILHDSQGKRLHFIKESGIFCELDMKRSGNAIDYEKDAADS
ncbi:hypothetical protein BVSY1_35430 [Bacillus velezensis]|nr:hypothetical protein BVSY1_35430 [Bacillus velezensis]